MVVHSSLLHRLDAVALYSYRVPLRNGIREGLILRGKNSWGEIAPYPGRSRETLQDCIDQLLHGNDGPLFPSVQFGIENASRTPHTPLSALLYAFFTGTPDEVLRQADLAESRGYTVAKVKISSREEAHFLLKALQHRFNLRIDCNMAFSFDEAVSLFSPYTFEFIEDPTYELERLAEFPLPFAIDEPLHILQPYPQLKAVILKPTLLGGRQGCTPYVEFAKKHHLKVVFSPAYESGLGLLQILFLAQDFNLLHEPIGLDTYRFLQKDVLTTPLDFSKPIIHVAAPPTLNMELLNALPPF